jgi:SAM-dependent methyltransferase
MRIHSKAKIEFLGYNLKAMRYGIQTDSSRSRKPSYDGTIAQWWEKRAHDSAHQRAYRKIADFIHASFPRDPRLVIDFACGAGNLLSLLSRRFARSKMVGLDGSAYLLGLAERKFCRLPPECKQRIVLIHTTLPDFSLLRGQADLVVFCFPNMMPPLGPNIRTDSSLLSRKDLEIAGRLAISDVTASKSRKNRDSQSVRQKLEYGRCISQNLRRLLLPGGICVRVEYATTQRHEWSAIELQKVCFEEGALDTKVDGLMPRKWFHVLASAYFRSHVMEDVYQQTGDRLDRKGGYLLTVLRAL